VQYQRYFDGKLTSDEVYAYHLTWESGKSMVIAVMMRNSRIAEFLFRFSLNHVERLSFCHWKCLTSHSTVKNLFQYSLTRLLDAYKCVYQIYYVSSLTLNAYQSIIRLTAHLLTFTIYSFTIAEHF
jgi:hypothetical protein